MKYLARILVLAICIVICKTQCQVQSSAGKTFVIAVAEPFYIDKVDKIFVNIAASVDGTATFTSPYLKINQSYALTRGVTTVTFNNSIISQTLGKGNKGIELTSDVDVTVYVFFNGDMSQTDGYLALPTENLTSMQFMFPSFSKYTQCLIASSMDNVRIDIHSNNNIVSVNLDRYQTYQLKINNSDFDQLIYSNGSVTVLYEERLLNILYYSTDLAFEQLHPIQSWGTSFIVPSLIRKSNNVFRITTGNYSVRILIQNSTFPHSVSINPLSFKDIYFKNESIFLQSDRPIQVVQFCTSVEDGNAGDPFITVVPPLTNFLSEYIFKPMDTFNHYVTVTVQSKYVSGLLLNDKSLSIRREETISTNAGSYKILTLVVNTATNILRHAGGHEFGALLYGYFSSSAYGYPLGLKLSADYCVTSTVTQLPSTQTSLVVRTGPICMSCSDMVHVELCDHVEHCSYGEVCFMEKYAQMENEIRFRSGCKLAQDCTQHSGKEHCTECCSDDFCNSRGCGEAGISGVLNRGPLCYDCSYATSPEECNVISLCNQGQVCSVEEYAWGNSKHFEMECQNSLECGTTKREIGEKRSTLTCKHCCDSDFCNTSCNGTVGGHEVAIVG